MGKSCAKRARVCSTRKLHEKDGKLSCSMCSKKFSYLSHLQRHQLCHLNVRDYECPYCQSQFVQKIHLRNHISRKHNLFDQSSRNFDENNSLFSQNALKKVECNECGAFFESLWHLKRHQSSVHSEHQCKVCLERFPSIGLLRSHSSLHDSTRHYKCSHCQQKFKRKCELRIHEQTHIRSGTFLCIHCSAVFVQRTQLDRHLSKMHITSKDCDTCGEKFSAMTLYRSHMSIIHNQNVCAYCGNCDNSIEHRENNHWRRLSVPLPINSIDSKDGDDLDFSE